WGVGERRGPRLLQVLLRRPGGRARIRVASRRGGIFFRVLRRGCRRLLTGGLNEFARGLPLYLADRFFQGEAFARDIGLIERGLHAAQLCKQGCARVLIERTAALAVVCVENRDSACYERVVIGHRALPTRCAYGSVRFHSRTGSASGCLSAPRPARSPINSYNHAETGLPFRRKCVAGSTLGTSRSGMRREAWLPVADVLPLEPAE